MLTKTEKNPKKSENTFFFSKIQYISERMDQGNHEAKFEINPWNRFRGNYDMFKFYETEPWAYWLQQKST